MFIHTCRLYSHNESSVHGHELFENNVKCQQDRQCTYNVTLRRVRATIVAVEKQ